MIRRSKVSWLFVALAVCTYGCGGSGPSGPGAAPVGAGSLALTVQFPPASRSASWSSGRQQPITGIPEGAAAVRVEILDPATNSSLAASQLVTAPAIGASTSVQFTGIRAGPVLVRVSAYPDAAAVQPPIGLGTATATVQANQTTNVTVPVLSTAASITVSPSPVTIGPAGSANATATLTATVMDSQNNTLAGYPLVWSSGNTMVATVSPNPSNPNTATVQGVQTGTATIQVRERNSGLTANVTVTVSTSAAATTGTTTGTTTTGTTTTGTTTTGTTTTGTTTGTTTTSGTVTNIVS